MELLLGGLGCFTCKVRFWYVEQDSCWAIAHTCICTQVFSECYPRVFCTHQCGDAVKAPLREVPNCKAPLSKHPFRRHTLTPAQTNIKPVRVPRRQGPEAPVDHRHGNVYARTRRRLCKQNLMSGLRDALRTTNRSCEFSTLGLYALYWVDAVPPGLEATG